MKSRVVAVKTAPNKISIEFQNGTVWEYEKGEVSYTEWTLGKPTDWFIPNELDFLKKINRYIEEAIMLKTVEKNAAEFWQKSAIQDAVLNKDSVCKATSAPLGSKDSISLGHQVDAAKYGVSYMTIGRRCGKSQVAAHMAKQTLQNKKLPPRPSKHRLVVWKDYKSFRTTGCKIVDGLSYSKIKEANVHFTQCDLPQHVLEKFRGYTFDHVLFIDCDESFVPPELTCTMHYAKITYCK